VSVWGGESIHDAILSSLASAPTGSKVTQISFTYNADGSINTISFLQGSTLLFTLTFAYSAGSVVSITRS
jgi:hypothetical protein